MIEYGIVAQVSGGGSMTKDFRENIKKYEVLTPDGFKPFAGVSLMGTKPIWRVETASGLWLECTNNHKLFVNAETRIPLHGIKVGDELLTTAGFDAITSIEDTCRVEPVYDLVEVAGGHKYYANNILSSNCEFIVFEETLINAVKIANLKGKEPIRKSGQVRWYKNIDPELTYVVGLDPSMGTGGDNAAIQVWELPTMKQVGEWMHNRTPIEGQMRVFKEMLAEVYDAGATDIYWSIETNSLGEAALVVVRDTGEENFPGTFLHDPSRALGKNSRRKGFVTTNRSKLEACAKLKEWVENGKMHIASKPFLSELKNFIAKGSSYQAREGSSDDLVSAALLFSRMAAYIGTWDDMTYDMISSDIGDDEGGYESPMPVLVM